MRRNSLLKHLRHRLTLVALMCLCSSIQANEQIMSSINRIAVNGYEAVNAYYNYGANIGDKSILSKVSESVAEMEGSIQALKEEAKEETFSAEVKKLEENYKSFSGLLKANLSYVEDNGYPDLRLSDDLARSNKSFSEDLQTFRDKLLTTLDYKPNPQAESCRQIALTLSNLVAKYSARSTSSVSQIFQGSETETPIAEIVSIVDDNLSRLTSGKNNTETKKHLNSTATKWKFVKNSYLNYNEKNVNYVINLYTEKMIQEMKEAELAYIKMK